MTFFGADRLEERAEGTDDLIEPGVCQRRLHRAAITPEHPRSSSLRERGGCTEQHRLTGSGRAGYEQDAIVTMTADDISQEREFTAAAHERAGGRLLRVRVRSHAPHSVGRGPFSSGLQVQSGDGYRVSAAIRSVVISGT
ncbi:hypothetical protein GCM10011492_43500 [Flexivirga endophytica]|uniref:Uncharacterized protein n=1 Tax=Flexivirga endophytica TaxID=1849103 RepID=A0A916TJ48_9MICO|nr:hypothetical protein GCM10011492_43500 [Flexivirga endophytica]GHB60547.1 hypothetical protein GCM10008112_31880 [Flexivirga endophytica]